MLYQLVIRICSSTLKNIPELIDDAVGTLVGDGSIPHYQHAVTDQNNYALVLLTKEGKPLTQAEMTRVEHLTELTNHINNLDNKRLN